MEPELDTSHPASLPGIDELEQLLVELEVHREHPHTIALHDVLYELERQLREEPWGEGCQVAMGELVRVSSLEHPLRARLLELTGQEPPPPQRSLVAVLAAEPGVPVREDPLESLELHLRQRREMVHLLEERQEELVHNLQRTAKLLDLAAGLAALLFLFAGLGWAIALDWFSVSDDQIVDESREDDKDDASPSEGRQDRRSQP